MGSGTANRCVVTKAAYELARDYWNSEFSETDQLEKAERTKLLVNRKKIETLYVLEPDREPVLIDELFWHSSDIRNEEEMAWVEQRLIDLGFEIVIQDRIKTYIDKQDTCIVYADPRAKGQIYFTVYKRLIPNKPEKLPTYRRMLQSFRIADNWKNDLRGKYHQRVEQALNQ